MKGNAAQAHDFNEVQGIVGEVRYIIKSLKTSNVTLFYEDESFFAANANTIKQLAHLQAVSPETDTNGQQGIQLTNTRYSCWLNIDTSKLKAYVKEIIAKQALQKSTIAQLQARLNNKSYVKNAPSSVVDETKHQLEAAQALLATLQAEEQRFQTS